MTDSMMDTMTVAWATPVNHLELGSQLEAYARSKAPVHTFTLCVKYGCLQGKPSAVYQ